MGLDTLYANKVEEGIKRWTDNPGPAPAPSNFSAWSFLSAGAKGAPAGLLESFGSTADAISLFAAPGAATFGAMDGADPAGVEQARQKMLTSNSFDPAAGDALRRKADTFLPDPQTATTADQTIAGLTRGVTKAVASIATLGPVPGAIAFGADEGNNAGQRLRMEGVDTGTAFKVGAVTAAANTAGAMIPMGGSTIAKTVGLAAVGGPGTFIAQEALSKKILADAGYKDQASLHDPLDPLGLTLSTVIPFGFGAMHLRGVAKARESAPVTQPTLASVVQTMESGGQRFGKDGQILQGPMTKVGTAKGEMQVVDSTNLDPGFGVKPAADNSPAERARVGHDYLAAMEQRYGGDPEKAMAAYNAGPGALDKAIAAHGNNWLAHMPAETQKYVAKGSKMLGDQTVAHASSNPDVVDAARVKVTQAALHENLPDFPTAHAEVMRASDELAAGRFPDVQEAPAIVRPAPEPNSIDPKTPPAIQSDVVRFDRVAPLDGDHIINASLLDGDKEVGSVGMKETRDAVRISTSGIDDVDSRGKGLATNAYEDIANYAFSKGKQFHSDGSVSPDAQRLYQSMERRGYTVERNPKATTDADGYLHTNARQIPVYKVTAPPEPHVQPARAAQTARTEGTNALPDPRQPTIESAAPKITADTESKGPASIDSQRVAAIAETDPGLKVKLPGSDETLTVGEALSRAKEQAKEEADYGKLIKAAADCALSFV